MTKQEFVDAVASRANLSSRDARSAVDAFLDTITDALKRRDTSRSPASASSRPATAPRARASTRAIRPEGAHPGRDRAEVLGRQPAEGGGQGRLGPRLSSERREAAAHARRGLPRLRRGLQANICSPRLSRMQLSFDAADRLVELVEERRGPVPAEEAARALFALAPRPGRARAVAARRRRRRRRAARLARRRASGSPTPAGAALPLEDATYVVVDLETTGLSPGSVRDLRDRRGARRGARARGAVRDARRTRAGRCRRRSPR